MKELAEPEVASRATTSATAGVRGRVAAGAKMRQLLFSVGVLPGSLFLPS